jgi:hypothetical protein
MKRMLTMLALSLVAAATGCGGMGTKPACVGDCMCTDTECACRAGGTCTFGAAGPALEGGDGGLSISMTAPPPDNVSYHCDSQNSCDLTCGTGCTNTCGGRSTCEGSCTSNCTSSCAGTSSCTLETGVNSQVTCEGGSTCEVKIDTGSTITCRGESTCKVECPKGGCTADCGGAAECTVVCGAGAACQITCNGTRVMDCGAGATCRGVCTGSASDGGSRARDR